METKQAVVQELYDNPQTVHTLTESLANVSANDIQSILDELVTENIIEVHEQDILQENNQNNVQFLWIMQNDNNKIISNTPIKMNKINNNSKRNKIKTIKSKSTTKKKRKFKPPRFKQPKMKNTSNILKSTGIINKKSKTKLIGKKRKFNDISDQKDKDINCQPLKKRIKYNNNNSNNSNNSDIEELTSLKYTEDFLLSQINKLKQVNNSNKLNKKDKNCLEYHELVELTEKWTVATQEIIQAIIDGKNDPDATTPKLLEYFQIPHKMVRWNADDEEFE